jgi:hypothetical protein
MQAVTGTFRSRSDAERAFQNLHSAGIPEKQLTLLTPESTQAKVASVPTVASEQPGMGKAIGAIVGAAAGFSGGPLILAAILPGIGPITAIGLLGGAVLAAAGAEIGAVTGGKLENSMTDGLPEDEIYLYEDALHKGRSVVIAMTDDGDTLARLREILKSAGAEEIDAAREQWWIGLRGVEDEHYSSLGKSLNDDEKFYRLGFEAALHARSRCKEYDQVLGEMTAKTEELEKQYPGVDVATPFTHGYERGREYYQKQCNESKAA